MDPHKHIPFVDVQGHRKQIGKAIDEAVSRVLAHGRYVMGPEVEELENALSMRTDGRHVISCANGTDALHLCLRAFEIKPGDAIFVPAFTFAATAEAICLAGGTPVFVDIESETYNISCESLQDSIEMVLKDGLLKPTGIIAVDLFGHPAAYPSLEILSNRFNLWVLEDAAQALGARLQDRPCGTFGRAAATSFFPAKPLGAYGDGGAIFVDDKVLAEKIRSLRSHGQGGDKYKNIRIGMNSRLDTLQAAVLLQKLKLFDDELDIRNKIAQRYSSLLKDVVNTPTITPEVTSIWAQYTIETPKRKQLTDTLKKAGIPTAIYYPYILPNLPAYQIFPVAPSGTPVAEAATSKVLSLPMHAYLSKTSQDHIVSEIRKFFGTTI